MNAIGKHRVKKMSEMDHLRGRFCFHILKNMAQNNNISDTAEGCSYYCEFLGTERQVFVSREGFFQKVWLLDFFMYIAIESLYIMRPEKECE